MTETLPSTGTFCLGIVSRSEREGVFTEIVYVSKLIAEKDSSGSPHGTLKEDKSFSETKQLEGENGALKEFFKDLYAGKGLHISIICAHNINTNDIDQIFTTQSLSSCNQIDCCTSQRAFRISDLSNESIRLSFNHQHYYQEGCYWDCISLQNSSILEMFQKIIDCLAALGKNTEKVSLQLTAMRSIETAFLKSGINPCLNAQYMKEFSDNMVSYTDIEQEYASIYILFILRESSFEMFQISKLYFPVHIEYVVKGVVPPEQIIESQKREIERLRQELQKYQRKEQTQQRRSGQEVVDTSRTTIYNSKKVDKDTPIYLYSSTKSASTPTFRDEGYDVCTPVTEHDDPKKTKKFNPENENIEVR